MDKADFLEQFTSYNELIENALISQNFDRVVSLDVARREMLHKFTKNNSPDQDLHFFKSAVGPFSCDVGQYVRVPFLTKLTT